MYLDGSRLISNGCMLSVSDLLDNLWSQSALVGHTHISSECRVWNPFGGGTRTRLFHHAVNLLERQALGLGNEEIGVDEAASAERAPDEEDARSEIGISWVGSDHVWGDDCDDTVPEPVGGSRECDTT